LVLVRQPTLVEVEVMRLVPFSHLPYRHRSGKVLSWLFGAVAMGLLACCGSAVFFSMKSKQEQEVALAEADKLYATKPAEAVAKYKEGYDAAGDRKAEVLQRIVDHEAGAGNTAEATKWVERGINDKLTVSYTSAAAKELHAKAQKDKADREAAKRAEAEAKVKQRDDNKAAKDQVKANKNLPRDQFRMLVNGKTEQQVIDALGKPDQTQDVEGTGKMWYYHNAAVDPVTGKKTALVQVVFEGGVVATVNFN
jgi:hypothetical protein